MYPELSDRFAVGNHNCFVNKCCITLIDYTDGSDLRRREEFWEKVLKTVAAYGLLLHAFTH